MLLLLSRIPTKYLIGFGLFVVILLWFNIWLSGVKHEAAEQARVEVITTIKEQTEKAIKTDAETIKEQYENVSTAINDNVSGMLSKSAGSDGSRLLGTKVSTRTADGIEARANMGTPDQLSDKEIDAIQSYSDLLQ